MTPQEDYNEKCIDAEARKLMDKVSALTADERENIFKTGNQNWLFYTACVLIWIFHFSCLLFTDDFSHWLAFAP